MLSFLRSLLQVALGFVLGFFVAAYFLPETRSSRDQATGPVPKGPTVVVTKTNPDPKNATAPELSNLFGRPSAGRSPSGEIPSAHSSAKEPAIPERETPIAEIAQPKTGGTPLLIADSPPVAEGPVDFRELCIKPAAWPPAITLNKDVNAEVVEGEEVIAEIPLSAGERVQVSKVFGDGTVEVRAKGAKFVLRASDTDLAAQARIRLAEISGKARAPVVVDKPDPKPEPKPETKPTEKPSATEPAKSSGGDDLDRKMKSLFGTPQKRQQ